MKREQVSIEFDSAFNWGGSVRATCQGCNRTFFNSHDVGCFDSKEELNYLVQLSQEKPDKYIDTCGETVGLLEVNGITFVYQCDCGKARQYEDFIWESRVSIMEYLKKRLSLKKERILSECSLCDDICGD